MKVMLLAAGRGERLRPLTDEIPKPLVTVKGEPLVVHHLKKCAAIGWTDIIMNVAYHAEKIMDALGDGSQFGVNITYSVEDPVLEVGGGIVRVLPWLGSEPFLLLSSDIRSDYPYETLLLKDDMLAHCVMVPNPDFHPAGDFGLEDGLLSEASSSRYTYGNIGVYHPELFKGRLAGYAKLTPWLREAIARKKVSGEIFRGKWFNIGTHKELEAVEHSAA